MRDNIIIRTPRLPALVGRNRIALWIEVRKAFAPASTSDRDWIIDNRNAILVLAGAYEEALPLLQARLERHPTESSLRFTLATCLLHLERYEEAAAYEQAIAEDNYPRRDDTGLKAARRRQQLDWASL